MQVADAERQTTAKALIMHVRLGGGLLEGGSLEEGILPGILPSLQRTPSPKEARPPREALAHAKQTTPPVPVTILQATCDVCWSKVDE